MSDTEKGEKKPILTPTVTPDPESSPTAPVPSLLEQHATAGMTRKERYKRQALILLRRYVPVITWGPKLTRQQLLDDVIGGFIVGVMIVPTCLSWASLAGLPLSCGLSAALFALLSYGTFGQCAVIAMGPVAELTTLLISIPNIAEDQRQNTYASLGVQVGLLSIVLSFIDGGKVIKTIFAKAVGDGYTCAAALLAISSQLKVMFNVTAPQETLIQAVLWAFIKALWSQCTIYNILAFLLCLTYTLYLIQIKKTRLPVWIPHQLIIVVVSTFVTFIFRLDEKWGLTTVKSIPNALSLPHFPSISNVIGLGPYTLTIAMISFVQIYVIAQRVDPNLNPNSELFASGATNFLCNIMNGMPVTNSFSCSSVLLEQHVQTPLTSYVAGFVLLITIVFLTRLGVFYYLPKQALGAIVVASVWRLVDFSGPMRLWKYSKMDAAVWIFTFALTMVGGITIGVLSGIMLSLVLVVLRIARPRVVCVGFNMATLTYGDLRKDQELLVYPNILLWRFDAPLYFVNIGFFQEKLMQSIENEVRPIDVVIVTCERVVDIDSAALAAVPTVIKSVSTYKRDAAKGEKPRRILLTCIHGRLETVLFSTAAIPIYVPEEYDRLPMEAIEQSGKFPVVFKKLEDSIRFAQRLVSESYGVYDTSPYPNVSFLTDAVIEAARYISPGAQLRGAAATTVARIGDRGKAAGNDGHSGFGHEMSDMDDEENEEADGNEVSGSMALARTLSNLSIIRHPNNDEPVDGAEADDEADKRMEMTLAEDPNAAATPAPTFLDEGVLERLKRLKRLSTFTPDRELIGVIGVVRHAEQTPKQKKKIFFADYRLLELAFHDLSEHPSKEAFERSRSPEELDEFFNKVEELLQRGVLEPAKEWRRTLTIVRSRPQSLHIQIKPFIGTQLASFGDASMADMFTRELVDEHRPIDAAMLIVKWGGVLTKGGISQAHVLGEKLFARFFAAGDIPLSRLLRFISHPRIYSTDQSRVYNTALVVMRAITQSPVPLTKRDIIIDDDLMKKLSSTAKRLLQEEYRYYEMLLHINSQGASRHFFHIPGFRQLLLIPLLDRPFASNPIPTIRDSDDDDEVEEEKERPRQQREEAEEEEERYSVVDDDGTNDNTIAGNGNGMGDNEDADVDAANFPHDIRGFVDEARSIHFGKGGESAVGPSAVGGHRTAAFAARAWQRGDGSVANLMDDLNAFYTPFQVLKDLHEKLATVVQEPLPAEVLNVPLGNHETFGEMRLRYDALLKNYLGAKRENKAAAEMAVTTIAHRTKEEEEDEGNTGLLMHPVPYRNSPTMVNHRAGAFVPQLQVPGSVGSGDDEDGPNASPGGNSYLSSVGGTFETVVSPGSGNTTDPNHSSEDEDEQDPVLGELLPSPSRAASSSASCRSPLTLPNSATGTPPPAPALKTAADERTARRKREKRTTFVMPSSSPTAVTVPSVRAYASKRKESPLPQPDVSPLPNVFTGTLAGHTRPKVLYDLSDASKLRDYAAYDLSYNVPVLRALYRHLRLPGIRHVLDALERTDDIVDSLARVGENVLEGINSSKRFIIGSLVSGNLLNRIYDDFKDLAAVDEARGVRELHRRAQRLYMSEKGGVEQDVRHFVKILRRIGLFKKKKNADATTYPTGGAPGAARNAERLNDGWNETKEEREFRLRFPFISLPDEALSNHDPVKKKVAGKTDDDNKTAYTRFYFTSYLHVEGVLQCLFENNTVEGFSRPTKEELEVAQQLYMKHVIFKVFRRRNFSYTDVEVDAAFRKLHLLFRTEMDYEKQQRDLHKALTNIYHSMYFVSMEVYLSLGNVDNSSIGTRTGAAGEDTNETPLFTVHDLDGTGELTVDLNENGSIARSPGEVNTTHEDYDTASDHRTGSGSGADGGHSSYSDTGSCSCSCSDTDDDDEDGAQGSRAGSRSASFNANTARYTVPAVEATATPPAAPAVTTTPTPSSTSPSPAPAADPTSPFFISPLAKGFRAPREKPTITTTTAAAAGTSSGAVSENSTSKPAEPAAAAAAVATSQASSLQQEPQSPADRRPRVRHHRCHHYGDANCKHHLSVSAQGGTGSGSGGDSTSPGHHHHHHHHHRSGGGKNAGGKGEATVMITPEAGRAAAAVQEMKMRVSNVTPMRRIHEGINLDEFHLLVREAMAAVRSQRQL